MTFLNASLVIGTLAALIPIVLHLIGKREPKKVRFPSIRFLTKRIETHNHRLKIRRWWLLAMRMLALASLAMALARPTIHRSLSLTWLTIGLTVLAAIVLLVLATLAWSRNKSSEQSDPSGRARSGKNGNRWTSLSLLVVAGVLLTGSSVWALWTSITGKRPLLDSVSPVAIAVLIDNGPTWGWKDHRTQAMDAASALVSQLPRTSRISIVDRSSNPPTFSVDVSGALSKIEQLHPVALARPLRSRMQAAARLLGTSELENRQLVIVTDLANQTWGKSGSRDAGKPLQIDFGYPRQCFRSWRVSRNQSLAVDSQVG